MRPRLGFLLLLVLFHREGLAGDFWNAFASALLNEPTYQAAKAERDSTRQNLPMARAGLLPSASLSVSEAKVGGTRTSSNAQAQDVTSPLDYRAPNQSFNVRVPLLNWEASQKVSLAENQTNYAEAMFAVRQAELLDRVATAYLQRVLAELSTWTATASLEASQSQASMASRRLQLGEGTLTDVAEAEAALASTRGQLLEAQSQRQLAELSLLQMTGAKLASVGPTVGSLSAALTPESIASPAMLLSDLLAQAESTNPSLVARRHAVAAAQAAVARNRAGHYPKIDLVASATSVRNESISTLNQSSNQHSVGLQLNMPIFNGGYVNASVKQAVADVDKAEAELLAEQQSVAREVTKYYLSVASSAAKLHAARKAMDSANLTRQGAVKGGLAGVNTKTDATLALRKVAQANLDLNRAIAEHLLARLRLALGIGVDAQIVAMEIDGLLDVKADRWSDPH